MNYLETGLPHTEFYRKKTQFHPPRFIPLCTLGRKYLGLEPLSKREVKKLVNRLSEPKKTVAEVEEVRNLTPVVKEVRHRTPGTGRFVGAKKMNSFQIEKMVDRLYSRRATKDYAFVDETVQGDDILNMTDRMDDSSDSEDESKEMKERQNSFLRRQSNVSSVSKTSEREQFINRRDTMETRCSRRDDISTEIPRLKLDCKHRPSVMFASEISLIDETGKINNANVHALAKRQVSACSPSPGPRHGILHHPPTVRSNSYTSANTDTEVAKLTRSGIRGNAREQQRPKSEPITRQRADVNIGSLGPDTQRTNKKCFAFNKLEKLEHISASKTTTPARPTSESPRIKNAKSESDLTLNLSFQADSPRSRSQNSEVNRSPRFVAPPPDDMLIDKVATFNRSPRLRCT